MRYLVCGLYKSLYSDVDHEIWTRPFRIEQMNSIGRTYETIEQAAPFALSMASGGDMRAIHTIRIYECPDVPLKEIIVTPTSEQLRRR